MILIWNRRRDVNFFSKMEVVEVEEMVVVVNCSNMEEEGMEMVAVVNCSNMEEVEVKMVVVVTCKRMEEEEKVMVGEESYSNKEEGEMVMVMEEVEIYSSMVVENMKVQVQVQVQPKTEEMVPILKARVVNCYHMVMVIVVMSLVKALGKVEERTIR